MTYQANPQRFGFRELSPQELLAVSGGVVSFTDGTAQTHNDKHLPTTWDDTTTSQKFCIGAAMLFSSGDELYADIVCWTDLTGQNPNQTGLTPEEKRARDANALKEAGSSGFDQAKDQTEPNG